MSAWAEQGFPNIELLSPYRVICALINALSERIFAQTGNRISVPDRLTQINNNFMVYFDDILSQQCKAFCDPQTINNFYGDVPNIVNFTFETLLEKLGEDFISGQKKLNPRYFTAWAKQRYRMLNLLYITIMIDNDLSLYGKSRDASSSDINIFPEIENVEWNYGTFSTIGYPGIITLTTAEDISTSREKWFISQNVITSKRNLNIFSSCNVKSYARLARPDMRSYSEDTITETNDLGGVITWTFDALDSGGVIGGWKKLKDQNLSIGAQTFFDFNLNDFTLSEPIFPSRPPSGAMNENISGFYYDKIYFISDFSPSLQYLDLPQF